MELLVQINLHLVLGIGERSIQSLVVAWVNIAQNSLLQLLCGTGYAWVIYQGSFGVDAREVLVYGDAVAVVATLLSQFGIVDDAQTGDYWASVEYLSNSRRIRLL